MFSIYVHISNSLLSFSDKITIKFNDCILILFSDKIKNNFKFIFTRRQFFINSIPRSFWQNIFMFIGFIKDFFNTYFVIECTSVTVILVDSVWQTETKIVQGQPTQTGFFELALRNRNVQIRFFWKVFLKSCDLCNQFSWNASCASTAQFAKISCSLLNFELLWILGAISKL